MQLLLLMQRPAAFAAVSMVILSASAGLGYRLYPFCPESLPDGLQTHVPDLLGSWFVPAAAAVVAAVAAVVLLQNSSQVLAFAAGHRRNNYKAPDVLVVFLAVVASLLVQYDVCLLYTSPSPRDGLLSRMPSSA